MTPNLGENPDTNPKPAHVACCRKFRGGRKVQRRRFWGKEQETFALSLSLCSFELGRQGYLIGSVPESPGVLAHFNTGSSVKYQMKAEVVPFPKHHQAWGDDIMRRRTISAKVDQQCKCAHNWSFVSRRQNISRRTYVSYN